MAACVGDAAVGHTPVKVSQWLSCPIWWLALVGPVGLSLVSLSAGPSSSSTAAAAAHRRLHQHVVHLTLNGSCAYFHPLATRRMGHPLRCKAPWEWPCQATPMSWQCCVYVYVCVLLICMCMCVFCLSFSLVRLTKAQGEVEMPLDCLWFDVH